MAKRKITALLVMVFVLLVSSYMYYSKIYLIDESSIPSEIQDRISKSETIDIGHLIDGEWDTLYIISPYTSIEEVKKEFGVNLDRLRNNSITYIDGQSLFVFCRDRQIQSYFYIKYPLAEVDYSSLPEKHMLPRGEAIFTSVNEQTTHKLVKLPPTIFV